MSTAPADSSTIASSAEREWNRHRLTPEEDEAFARDGFLVLPDRLPEAVTDGLEEAFDAVLAAERVALGASELDRLNVFDFGARRPVPGDDRLAGDLPQGVRHPGLEHPDLPLAYDRHPRRRPGGGPRQARLAPGQRPAQPRAGDHAAAARLAEGGVLPHRLQRAGPPGATDVLVPRGAIVLFDRRLWHTGSPNYADLPRKALFYGYSYRWLRPRDDMTVAHVMESCDPIRRQLLGASPSGGHGYTSPKPQDVPLRDWLEQNPRP